MKTRSMVVNQRPKIFNKKSTVFIIKSETSCRHYNILFHSDKMICSCPDFHFRSHKKNGVCKHINSIYKIYGKGSFQ